MSELEGRTVLITGGSGGLGRSLAETFAGAGARVAISARAEQNLQIAAKNIRRRGSEVLALTCDVSQKAQVEALEQAVRERFGRIQILINNAGIAPAVSFLDMADSLWEEVLRTNLTGTYNCCKVFLPGMIESGWGRIINIASTVAKVAYSHVSAYTSSKHGVLGLTRSLALETARLGVTVNAICPGYVDTELTHRNAKLMAEKTGKSVEEILQLFAKSSPQNRLIEPKEVAGLALMLTSEKAAGITGQAINVDGGAVMI